VRDRLHRLGASATAHASRRTRGPHIVQVIADERHVLQLEALSCTQLVDRDRLLTTPINTSSIFSLAARACTIAESSPGPAHRDTCVAPLWPPHRVGGVEFLQHLASGPYTYPHLSARRRRRRTASALYARDPTPSDYSVLKSQSGLLSAAACRQDIDGCDPADQPGCVIGWNTSPGPLAVNISACTTVPARCTVRDDALAGRARTGTPRRRRVFPPVPIASSICRISRMRVFRPMAQGTRHDLAQGASDPCEVALETARAECDGRLADADARSWPENPTSAP